MAGDRDVRGILRVEDTGQFIVVPLILGEVGCGDQPGACLHAELDVRAQVNCADQIISFGQIDHATALFCAQVDGVLYFVRGQTRAVADRAEFCDVEESRRPATTGNEGDDQEDYEDLDGSFHDWNSTVNQRISIFRESETARVPQGMLRSPFCRLHPSVFTPLIRTSEGFSSPMTSIV